MSNDNYEYKFIDGQEWTYFHGLMYSGEPGCLDYNGNSSDTWHYSIGTFDRYYGDYFPGPYFNGIWYNVKYVDLWIERPSNINSYIFDRCHLQNSLSNSIFLLIVE